jgi:hypothetical protein
VTVNIPDEPPALTPRAARALLEILVAEAERVHGPDWPERFNGENADE